MSTLLAFNFLNTFFLTKTSIDTLQIQDGIHMNKMLTRYYSIYHQNLQIPETIIPWNVTFLSWFIRKFASFCFLNYNLR